MRVAKTKPSESIFVLCSDKTHWRAVSIVERLDEPEFKRFEVIYTLQLGEGFKDIAVEFFGDYSKAEARAHQVYEMGLR